MKFFQKKHGLLKNDINVKNKQNFLVVQCFACTKVRVCLEHLDKGIMYCGKYLQEHVKGIVLYLEVIWSFLKIFCGMQSLVEKVKLTSFVVHILYVGSAYICYNRFGHYLKLN